MFNPFPDLKISLTCGPITWSEIIKSEDEVEYYSEAHFPSGKPDFKHYIRPIERRSVREIEDLAGDHFLFGYLECLWQSCQSPLYTFPAEHRSEIFVKVEHISEL